MAATAIPDLGRLGSRPADGAAAAAPSAHPDPARPGDALVELDGVEREFALGHTTVRALRGVSLHIGRGELAAVWGPSGSGKSTLMNVIGLVDRPTAGRQLLDGRDTAVMSDDELTDLRSRRIGFVFQAFNLVPVLDATENVMLPLQIQGVAAAAARRRAVELLDQVGLARFRAFLPDRLSGGQRQRVAIARALVAHPQLVIADEPTANLDSENADMVVELMRALNGATGVTFVFTTHDPRLLAHVRRRIHLKDGRIESDRIDDE
ncbi:MAG TPA: ABC transporter ATP-binding protein [Burkholderiaceae bacterium]|nr:ABC transporter ATP-binding protein [Burkholderiaceae bacterium]